MRVSISAIGSDIIYKPSFLTSLPIQLPIGLPTGFAHAWNLPLVGQITEADAANTVFSKVRMGTPTDIAPGIRPRGKLWLALLFQNHGFLCHYYPPIAGWGE
jgi:hypothetical protein